MTQNQLNTLAMYDAVLEYLDESTAVWTGIIPVEEKKTELATTVATIHSKSQDQQEKSPEGFTAAKNSAMDIMIQQAYKVSLKVKHMQKKLVIPYYFTQLMLVYVRLKGGRKKRPLTVALSL